MATLVELRQYLGTLATILWNYGATFPVPTLDNYETGEVGFEFAAALPGAVSPEPAEIKLVEIWVPARHGDFHPGGYLYDFVEHPLNRRMAFHRHDEAYFVREFGVVVHEHCEERLKQPKCNHCFGLPVNAYEAIRRFVSLWGQPAALGCAGLRCIG
ncbi:MAG: hypothetical protein M0T75_09270 [Chloroflexi bacterium]|nr:hypothetical protein [Chloroflexota bacterium]